ncbi:MAG: protein kinase [Myxococcales bacterium]|nr:protein kinase [Myxococcales bacterium]
MIAPPVAGVPVPSERFEEGDALLDRAARSITAAGRAHTVVDVLHARALSHYAEGLEQYLAIRLGSIRDAARAFRQVRIVVAACGTDELVQAPGVRARLYRIARDIAWRWELDPSSRQAGSRQAGSREAGSREAGSCEAGSRGAGADVPLPWRDAKDTHQQGKLVALRESLEHAEAELLELRYARELRPIEIAHVVDLPVEDVLVALATATERAAHLVHEDARASRASEADGRLRALLLEAFALRRGGTSRDEALLAGPEPLAPGALVADRYRIQCRVGTGAFGDVYRAEDVEVPGHVVALKLLHQPAYSGQARQTALRELRHLASVFHPSVVSLKDHGWFDGRLWFVMPWYDGETLESRLQRGGLGRAEARRIFEPLARALAAVHAAGLRHQDVKPENVFLAEVPGFGGERVLPILIDLGVAATEAEMLVAGTPTYFAPEVAAQFASGVTQKPRVTSKADVFSLALALRNALEPETEEDVPAGAIESFIERRAIERPDFPVARGLRYLHPSFARWLNLDPDARPTAEELAIELGVLTAPEDRRRRRWALWRWLLPLVALLGAGATAAVLHTRAVAAEETHAAAERVAAARQDLEAMSTAQRQLAADAEAIRGRLERERLGRTELERRLAEASATLQRAESQLTRARDRLSAEETARAAAEASLRDRQLELAAARERGEGLASELERERQARQRARERADHLEAERDRVETQLGIERARRAAADARASALESQLEEAITARRASERAARRARQDLGGANGEVVREVGEVGDVGEVGNGLDDATE